MRIFHPDDRILAQKLTARAEGVSNLTVLALVVVVHLVGIAGSIASSIWLGGTIKYVGFAGMFGFLVGSVLYCFVDIAADTVIPVRALRKLERKTRFLDIPESVMKTWNEAAALESVKRYEPCHEHFEFFANLQPLWEARDHPATNPWDRKALSRLIAQRIDDLMAVDGAQERARRAQVAEETARINAEEQYIADQQELVHNLHVREILDTEGFD